ncbi:uncharacterized protein LOC129705593 [Leucoraja erinacea]|uniref:uncharacterized protein LOC129705593 n=1 Tax=Leucoraja erinaceus TaxID=7782 RepID=UPI002454A69E|nr:uncharacterized protein LOC129705593 [Leucoraja erinacea]XP_055505186.1 uncharacterized protein LOC129705593 [Leucoraja erinacea]XP_055505195.1 uncharacterized protein LOC129705593 [Leucoraja erinacea]
MAPRRRKAQPKSKTQPTRQVETEGSQEIDVREEVTMEVGRVHTTTPPRPVKSTGTAAAATVADPDSDYAQGTDSSSGVKKGSETRTLPYEFTLDQEEELVDWYRANPELYDQNCQHYHNKLKKKTLLENKAKEFPGCTLAQLCQWFKSQIATYDKLSQIASWSGSGDTYVTQRKQWIMDKWFDEISSLSRFSSVEDLDSLEGTSGSTPSGSHQQSTRSRTTAGFIPTAAEEEERQATQLKLTKELVQQVLAAKQSMTQPQTPHERTVDIFLAYLRTVMLKIPENIWHSYTADALSRALSFAQPAPLQMEFLSHPHMGLVVPPHQQAYQQSLLGLPQMPSGPTASSPSSAADQLATTYTRSAWQPARSDISALIVEFPEYTSLNTPILTPVIPGCTTRSETLTDLLDTDHPSV